MFGHDASAECHGTKGRFAINTNPRSDRLTIMDQYGVRNECTPTYFERFREAFVVEAR